MVGLRSGMLDLTGRQRCLWGQVLRQLDDDGLLMASLPAALERLPPGSQPQAWIDHAECQGQVLPWMLRQLALRPQDLTLHALARDLGLCADSRERLQSSPGWRHWMGLDSERRGPGPWPEELPGQALAGASRTLLLDAWSRRLLCLWSAESAGASWHAGALVLDLGGSQLQPLDDAAVLPEHGAGPSRRWQLGGLPRHALEALPRSEARGAAVLEGGSALLRCMEGIEPSVTLPERLQSVRPASPLLSRERLGRPQAGPVLLLGADPGHPPQLCLALLQRRGGEWWHDASPEGMGGGCLCLDAQCRLLGHAPPVKRAEGRVLVLQGD